MNLNVSGHHLDMTHALRDYVGSKMERIERHFDHVLDAEVVLEVEKLRHKAEATMQIRGAKLHAEATKDDMYAAIDAMVDKLDRQTVKHKEKACDHHNREARHIDMSTD
ncbi:ribosome hibernation-promoting factor, HPF/YfiA family [Salinisphaera japonica]|uniref:Ribosome hibernation promoting factor n=1 Tax=Salinisphaera japonica YTM-1 TaxID=1209778 RepID=A0A423PUX3_9GAMM|nr:ribosome-associated translation inhibitor RaiA [Salinisphaera japonica]ROO29395.1 RNA polymerase subunit sigma-54 [Salinisphaera japonica YTM-1]|tara:strand:+ start:490 stop:816 length:327 start_codon:yes stop_codon:yes gene_type:complete